MTLPGKLTLIALSTACFAACAPDAWRSSDPDDALYASIQSRCPDFMRDGEGETRLQDPWFLDMTARYSARRITRESYVSGLSTYWNLAPDSAHIRCVMAAIAAARPDLAPPR